MIRANRCAIAAVIFLAAGLWTIFNFCHGDAGLAFALPVSGSKVSLNISTMGWPVLIGVPLSVIGALLLAFTFVVALFEQFVPHRTRVAVETREPDSVTVPADHAG